MSGKIQAGKEQQWKIPSGGKNGGENISGEKTTLGKILDGKDRRRKYRSSLKTREKECYTQTVKFIVCEFDEQLEKICPFNYKILQSN